MPRRELSLGSYDELLAEIERLQRGGYRRCGAWSLGQICRHLSYYFRGSLEGFAFRLPWPVRRLIGRPLLKRMLRGAPRRSGGRTIPASVPPPDVDEAAAVAELRALVLRLSDPARTTPLHPSPLFDRLTADEWRRLHLSHAAHHLSFLFPPDA